jgi:uncharacterized protein DUF6573
MSTHSLFGEVISSYSRKEAIDDGVLVDLMQDKDGRMVRELGFRLDIAMTAAAYQQTIEPTDGVLPPGQDRSGRLWDVLWMLRVAIRSASPDSHSARFHVWVSNCSGGRTKVELIQLKALSGPGDQAEPTLTIMLPDED